MSLLNLLPDVALRRLRKFILSHGRRLDADGMLADSERDAVKVAVLASRHSIAYQKLLQEHNMNASGVGENTPLSALPVLTKANTFERFTLTQLARPMRKGELGDVLTSSGRGGGSFGFRLTTREQLERSWFDIDLGLQDMFGVDQLSTLLVNCLPMGVVFRSRAVTVANLSVREDMACAILRDIGPHFQQTLLCTDPLFVRRLLDKARVAGVDWKALNTSVIMGEEMLVEAQRDYIAARMDMDLDQDPQRMIGSSFGVGELGLNLLFETRDTIRLRRAMRTHPKVASLLGGKCDGMLPPSVFCFNPLRCHIDILNPSEDGYGELCFSLLDRNAVILLPRYSTGDRGKLVARHDVRLAAQFSGTTPPWLPVVAVQGRIQDNPIDIPSVERIKTLIYMDPVVADQLSGAFRISKQESGQLKLTIQANSELAAEDRKLYQRLASLVQSQLSERVTLDVLGPQAFPWRPSLDYERKFPYLLPKDS